MGRLDNSPEDLSQNPDSEANLAAETGDAGTISPNAATSDANSAIAGSANSVLRSMTQDLRTLQQDLVTQLHQDIRRLQTEKSRLLNDIEKLQNQQQVLQSQYDVGLSRQQLAQQQAWAKQLALALANHLQTAMSQRLDQISNQIGNQGSGYPMQGGDLPQIAGKGELENTQRSIASLDDTLNRTFTSLRSDLNSYQSTLSQQINRMQELGQQGEAILEVLVSRISQQLQQEIAQTPRSPEARSPETRSLESGGYLGGSHLGGSYGESIPIGAANEPLPPAQPPVPPTVLSPTSSLSPDPQPPSSVSPNFSAPPLSPTPDSRLPTPDSRLPTPRPNKLSPFQLGLVMVLCSTLALSLHNVIVGLVGNPSKLFGLVPIGGYINISSFGSSLFILWMRMLVVVPLMAWLGSVLHPPMWRDTRYFFESNDRRLIGSVVGSGFFLFLSQVLLYIAIGEIGPGVATTILFMYPIVTLPLSWLLFGERPNRFRVIVMVTILSGVILTALPKITATTSLSGSGVGAAIASGIFFAFYLVSMQISFRKLHPVPVSLIQFVSIFVLASLSLIVLGIQVTPTDRLGLFISGVVLGVLTLVGYLLNNFGVRFIGAARASIIAASSPVLTAMMAFFLIPGELTALHLIQLVGILIVTLGVTALSFERILIQNRKEGRSGSRASGG
ncbi:MAG: EamA family transporter [Drouetiella hepatica Uher 2000/2452]|jgi:drug/metabolite transporter (DMT)-like permease|uniref:EamA family transporter n=1 Tax=Drouetiella hepatica Uher 2000/2452 TaxID=904376 RepID=A0A951QB39_9CYAN|nr:EamA family transporter [Drouetiella hepatica Uher 2000/2452]